MENDRAAWLAALELQVSLGVDDALDAMARDRLAQPSLPEIMASLRNEAPLPVQAAVPVPADQPLALRRDPLPPTSVVSGGALLSAAASRERAKALAAACNTLPELAEAIANFDGLSIRRTASRMVFYAGSPKARVMLIGEAPGAEEDKAGEPFVGPGGRLLDRILAPLGLHGTPELPGEGVYLTNLLNWRPPGGRSPALAEIEISLAFLTRHIALIAPDLLIVCGGIVAKALLGSGEPISKLRGKFHDYEISAPGLSSHGKIVPVMPTYQPDYLLKTPLQKRLVWADICAVRSKI